MAALLATGLSDDALTSLGVAHPHHRFLLQTAATHAVSDDLRVAVPRWRLHGALAVFTVVARWKFFRSSTSMLYADFQKLDALVRQDLDGAGAAGLLARVPPLPVPPGGGGGGRDVDITAVQRALQTYLDALVAAVDHTPHAQVVLHPYLGPYLGPYLPAN